MSNATPRHVHDCRRTPGHPEAGVPPKDYHASFVTLGDIGVVDRDFAARIARAAGLRNRLVHDYDDLDPHRVFDALRAAVVDVPRYVAAVNAHLAQPAG